MRSLPLFAAACGLMACSPLKFDDLRDQAWVDDSEAFGGSKVVGVVGWAPRTGVPDGSHFILVADDGASAKRYDLSEAGERSTTELNLQDEDNDGNTPINDLAAPGSRLLATNPTFGLVVAAVRARQSDNYLVYLDTGSPTGAGDAITHEPGSQFPVAEDAGGVDIDWASMAVGLNDDDEFLLGALSAAEGETPSGTSLLVSVDRTRTAAACEIADGTFTTTGAIGFASESLGYFVGTDTGLALATQPATPGDPCDAAIETVTASIDGPIVVGNYTGDADREVFASSIGNQVLWLQDYNPGSFNERSIAAPAGASATFGAAIAIGDFDGDGDSDIAIGDPDAGFVHIYDLGNDAPGDAAPSAPAYTLEAAADGVADFGKSLAAVPFAGQHLLVVAGERRVQTFFRFDADQTDPRD